MRTDVVIVGAGAAGLAAAKALNSLDIPNIVLEASNRMGGRAFTDEMTFSVPCDLGAHWMHYGVKYNPFTNYGLSGVPFTVAVDEVSGNDAYYKFYERIPNGDGNPLPQNAAKEYRHYKKAIDDDLYNKYRFWKRNSDRLKDKSPHQEIAHAAPIFSPWFATIALLTGNWDMGKDWVDFSNNDYQHTPFSEPNPDYLCREGYGALLRYSARNVEHQIRFRTAAKEIYTSHEGVTVETDSDTLNAKVCIVTVSAGVIVAGLNGEQNALRIRGFPADIEAAFRAMPMGCFERIVLEFDRNFFGDLEHEYHLFRVDDINEGRPEGIVFTTNAFHENIVYADVGGCYARRLIDAGSDAMLQAVLGDLEAMLGFDVAPHIVHRRQSYWTINSLFRGAYASPLPGSAHQRKVLSEAPPINDLIYLAGEACCPSEWATVAGAHKSGCRAAKQVAKKLLVDDELLDVVLCNEIRD